MASPWYAPLPVIFFLWFSRKRSDFSYPEETHREWTLLGNQAGEFRYALGRSRPGICHPGGFVLCPPNVNLHRTALEPVSFYSIRFRWKPRSPDLWRGRHTLRDVSRLDSTLARLKETFDVPEHNGTAAWASQLLGDLLNQTAYESQNKPATPEAAPDRLMLKAAGEVRTGLARNTTLAELARELRISPCQFSRRFRATFGVSPNLFRARLRVQHARKLLLDTFWTMDRIAEACGFDNAFYFSRVFKKHTGQPPRDFRRRNRV